MNTIKTNLSREIVFDDNLSDDSKITLLKIIGNINKYNIGTIVDYILKSNFEDSVELISDLYENLIDNKEEIEQEYECQFIWENNPIVDEFKESMLKFRLKDNIIYIGILNSTKYYYDIAKIDENDNLIIYKNNIEAYNNWKIYSGNIFDTDYTYNDKNIHITMKDEKVWLNFYIVDKYDEFNEEYMRFNLEERLFGTSISEEIDKAKN